MSTAIASTGRRWRAGSVFGTGRRQPLDRNARARWRFIVACDRHRGRITSAAEHIATALLALLGEDGRLDPSIATLARRSGHHPATVVRGLAQLQAIGRVSWERRLRRDSGTRWRAEQVSNAYSLETSACDAQNARGTRFLKKERKERCSGGTKSQPPAVDPAALRTVAGAVDLLVARREAFEAQWRAKAIAARRRPGE